MGSGNDDKKKDDYTAPDPSPVAQQMIDALSFGPTGYSADIMKNLGMDVANAGYSGGARPTSGMTATGAQPFGYQQIPVQPDPLAPAVQQGPATPTDVTDLYMKYAGNKGAASAGKDKTDTDNPYGRRSWAGMPLGGGVDR